MDEAAPRQTLSYVKSLLDARGLRPKNKLGQNFLIDLNLIDLVVRTAEPDRNDLCLEVGTGTGSLTSRLAEHAGAVLSVELDPMILELARELIGPRPNVRLLRADALRNKNDLNPDVLAALAEMRQAFHCERVKLVANLPYAVATPVISNLLLSEVPVERMVVTVQWEIAERLMAKPGTADYGALAVLMQSLAEVELVRKLSPAVFWPRPLVDSAIVKIVTSAAKRKQVVEMVGEPLAFRAFLRDLYVHRRKNLRGALAGWPSGRREKSDVDRILAELGIGGTARAEDLDLETHLRLCRAFAGHFPASPS
jgi:16S rRNA (adenine1518-N6/adenine1519-N6)-dimethyltransferase